MTQHDGNIANQNFPATRADLNNALAALFSLSSGTSAPSTTVAGMLWYDTTNSIIKQRNAADSAWIHLFAIGKQGLIDQNGSTVYAADAGSTDAYAITLTPAPSAYAVGQTFRFKANTANTGPASLNVNGLGAITIKKSYNSDLATNDILANQIIAVIYDGTNFQMISPVANQSTGSLPAKYIAGFKIVTGTDTLNDLDIQTGVCRDDTNSADIILASTITKQSDAPWSVGTNAGGMDTGSKPTSGTLHLWAIKRSDTGVVDALYSTSATSPSMPANYDYKRLIGSRKTDSSGNIINGHQYGDLFLYDTPPALDVDVTNQSTSAVTRTLNTPGGRQLEALLDVFVSNSNPAPVVYLRNMDLVDVAPSTTVSPLAQLVGETGSGGTRSGGGQVRIMTNTSSQISTRADASGTTLKIATMGWIDRRGKDD